MSTYTNSTTVFENVSKDSPCPICKRPDWCSFKRNRKGEVSIVCCRREGDDVRVDCSGVEYYVHKLGDDDGGGGSGGDGRTDPTPPKPRHSHEPGEPDLLDGAYRLLLSKLKLSFSNQGDLQKRGFSDADVARLGYRSWPTTLDDRTAAVTAVVDYTKEKFGDAWEEKFLSIPGFWLRELRDDGVARLSNELQAAHDQGDKDEIEKLGKAINLAEKCEGELVGVVPELAGEPGILIPVRDEQGRIVRLQLRRDDATDDDKYRMLSSPVHRGSGAGMHPHVSLNMGQATKRIRVVEGIFKADMAAAKTGEAAIAYPSASAWRQALASIKDRKPETVVLPFDADVAKNKTVAGAMARFAVQLEDDGFAIEIETWDVADGKGIDDVIAAKHQDKIKVLRGRDMWNHILHFLKASGAPKNADVVANVFLSDLPDRAKADASWAFDPNVVSAAAWVGDGPRFQRLVAALKGNGINMTDWKRAVAKKRGDVTHEQDVTKAKASGKTIFRRGDDTEVAIRLLDALADRDRHGKPRHESIVFDEGVLHSYKADLGIWQPVSVREESLVVQGFAGSISGKDILYVNENKERGSIRLAHRRVHEIGFFEHGTPGFVFRNGFVEITSMGPKILPYSVDHRAQHRYEFDYRPSPPTRFLTFLDQVFRDDDDKSDRIGFLQEFFGACYLGIAPKYQKVVILFADGNNGKSKLAEIIENCFPASAVCSIAPHRWRDDYHVAGLAGKRLNLCGELPSADLHESEILKLVVSAESRVRARSPYREPFEFYAKAGHLFLANRLPGTADQSEGFWRRFIVLPFTRTFLPDEEDPGVVAKVLEDKPAIVSWIIDGAVRVLQQDGYGNIPKSTQKAKEDWQMDADPVRRFVTLVTVTAANTADMVSLETIYGDWTQWAATKNHRPMAENTFAQRMKQVLKGWARNGHERLTFLSESQRASVLREGVVHTKKGNRYPLMMTPKLEDITTDEIADIIDLAEARAKAGEGR